MSIPVIAITAGEPASIGPELLVRLAQLEWDATLVAIASRSVLQRAATALKTPLRLTDFDPSNAPTRHIPGHLELIDIDLPGSHEFGILNPANAKHVIAMLRRAASGAATGEFAAVVTAPVHKAVINEGGIAFTGHTEFFASEAGCDVVMLLAAGELRVALATTHLPLASVPAAIRHDALTRTLRILHADLISKFAIAQPRIMVLGLNPHAGENGHLGREEIDVIIPVLDQLRTEGMQLRGPLPADTGFLPRELARCDAVLAMYHDQGLPVLKHAGFGEAVNITLGLPWIRTSVDHGTALDLAGSGRADAGSLIAATQLAIQLANTRKPEIR